jgi:hypothetical protein
MPQIGTTEVDREAVKLFRAWITQVKQPDPPEEKKK